MFMFGHELEFLMTIILKSLSFLFDNIRIKGHFNNEVFMFLYKLDLNVLPSGSLMKVLYVRVKVQINWELLCM